MNPPANEPSAGPHTATGELRWGAPLGAAAAPPAAEGGAAALPCLKYNNSTGKDLFGPPESEFEDMLRKVFARQRLNPKKQINGRTVETLADGTEVILGGMSRAELKTVFVLEQNIAKLFRDYPIERIGFMTITFPREVVTPKEASRRFNSFRTHFLTDYAKIYIKVTEPHRDKRPHYHLLVVLPSDIRTGFDWRSFEAAKAEYSKNGKSPLFATLTRKYSASATPFLRRFWSAFRRAAKSHHLGRTEILPIKSEAEAAVRYVGKYIEKASLFRTGEWKGVRLVSCAQRLDRAANCQFSWVKGGRQWRAFVAEVAKACGIKEMGKFSDTFGKTWAYKILQCMSYGLTPNNTADLLRRG